MKTVPLFVLAVVSTTSRRPRVIRLAMWLVLLCCLGILPLLRQSSALLLSTTPPPRLPKLRTIAAGAAAATPTTTVLFSNLAHSATTASQGSSSSSRSTSNSITTQLPVGSDDFETWATTVVGAQIHPAISHALFPGGIRGLTWNNNNNKSGTAADTTTLPKEPVLRIPQAIVLSSVFDTNENNWDVDLACTLWEEMQKGANSRVSGYCQWLRVANGDAATTTSSSSENCPPSTAPHALRRWTEAQKQLLTCQPAGAALLELAQRQETAWRNKYQQIAMEKKNIIMSWEQFEWAMEVVHSRAFQGVNAGADSSLLSIAAPIVAAIAGYTYRNINPLSDTTPIVLGVLAVLAVLPTLLLRPKSSAVLLPLIDSANHLESADSSILFDPLGKTFDLTIGPACLDSTSTPTTQLYISYGRKGDRELLLNYGFLPNVKTMEDNLTNDEIRKRLASAFLQRNK